MVLFTTTNVSMATVSVVDGQNSITGLARRPARVSETLFF